MSRLHVHLYVNDLAQSVAFYGTLFGTAPAKQKADYAKWMLDDPCVNFAISTGGKPGLSHLGIEVDDATTLAAATTRARNAARSVFEEKNANCCYAVGDKSWAIDPQGVRWETFHTTGDLTVYGVATDEAVEESSTIGLCCRTAQPIEATTCCGRDR